MSDRGLGKSVICNSSGPIPSAAVHVANVSSLYGGPCPDPMIAGHTSRLLCQDSGCPSTPHTGQFVTSQIQDGSSPVPRCAGKSTDEARIAAFNDPHCAGKPTDDASTPDFNDQHAGNDTDDTSIIINNNQFADKRHDNAGTDIFNNNCAGKRTDDASTSIMNDLHATARCTDHFNDATIQSKTFWSRSKHSYPAGIQDFGYK